jgi:hypothetical protein
MGTIRERQAAHGSNFDQERRKAIEESARKYRAKAFVLGESG